MSDARTGLDRASQLAVGRLQLDAMAGAKLGAGPFLRAEALYRASQRQSLFVTAQASRAETYAVAGWRVSF